DSSRLASAGLRNTLHAAQGDVKQRCCPFTGQQQTGVSSNSLRGLSGAISDCSNVTRVDCELYSAFKTRCLQLFVHPDNV
ncbi:hypothetical protein BaRGS_00022686, partial [Batillaria attramentaria]